VRANFAPASHRVDVLAQVRPSKGRLFGRVPLNQFREAARVQGY
jgi:hypothetical protein